MPFLNVIKESIVQENDLTRIDISRSTVRPDEGTISKYEISVDEYRSRITDYEVDFTDSSAFTYDTDEAAFVDGHACQLDQTPTNCTFAATYTDDINGSYGDGTLDVKLEAGSPSVSSGKLLLGSNTLVYVEYYGDNATDLVQQGCVKVGYVPRYSGSPSSDQYILTIGKDNTSTVNNIRLINTTTGKLNLIIYDSAGTGIVQDISANFSPVAGTLYDIEANFNVTTGVTKLFVNGVAIGTSTGTGTRSSDIGRVTIGTGGFRNNNSNMIIDYVYLFSAVQHTADFTVESLPEYKFVETLVEMPQFETAEGTVMLTADINDLDITYQADPRFILEVDDDGPKYHDGSDWLDSDLSYDQATDVATFIEKLNDYDFVNSQSVTISFVFHATNVQEACVSSFTFQSEEIVTGSLAFYDITTNKYLDYQFTAPTNEDNESVSGTVDLIAKLTFGTNGGSVKTFPFSINIITADDDNLLSDDGDLVSIEPDIMGYLRQGRATYKDKHREAQRRILDYLYEKRILDSENDRLTAAAFIDVEKYKRWSAYLALAIIFENIMVEPDDIFSIKSQKYYGLADRSSSRAILEVDKDGDGDQEDEEYQDMRTFTIVRR